MVSVSSASEISKRAKAFFQKIFPPDYFNNSTNNGNFMDASKLDVIKQFLRTEYDSIPEKERIGKGRLYITKIIGKTLYNFIKINCFNLSSKEKPNPEFIEAVKKSITIMAENPDTLRIAIQLAANLAMESFEDIIDQIQLWGTHENWEIREDTCHLIISGLKKSKNMTLNLLKQWAKAENENIRRLVAESLRPRAEIKWLRDPDENDVVLEILTSLNHDSSIYVRKSVGNNLKDLTKYMPEKILNLIEDWLNNKEKLDAKGQQNLVWTIYHALRWLKAKKPEYHEKIKKLVGENYLLYYDEKKNRRALPPQQ